MLWRATSTFSERHVYTFLSDGLQKVTAGQVKRIPDIAYNTFRARFQGEPCGMPAADQAQRLLWRKPSQQSKKCSGRPCLNQTGSAQCSCSVTRSKRRLIFCCYCCCQFL